MRGGELTPPDVALRSVLKDPFPPNTQCNGCNHINRHFWLLHLAIINRKQCHHVTDRHTHVPTGLFNGLLFWCAAGWLGRIVL